MTAYTYQMLNLTSLTFCSIPLLLFVQLNTILHPWQSRKVLHIGTGTLFILSDVYDWKVRFGIYTVSIVCSLIACFFSHAVPISDKNDTGIIAYLALCSFAAFMQIPFSLIAPMFFADPAGALVGKTFQSPTVYGKKTALGSLAVFLVAYLSLPGVYSWPERAIHAFVICIVELLSGKFDNALIGSYLILLVMHHA